MELGLIISLIIIIIILIGVLITIIYFRKQSGLIKVISHGKLETSISIAEECTASIKSSTSFDKPEMELPILTKSDIEIKTGSRSLYENNLHFLNSSNYTFGAIIKSGNISKTRLAKFK